MTTGGPYLSHLAENEESMLDWEGQLQHTKFMKRNTYDKLSVSSVTMDIYSDDVDSVIANSFTIKSSYPPFVSMAESEANDFDSMLEAKAENSKFGASIGSMYAGNNEGYELLSVSDYLTLMHWDEINFASISSAQANNPKTIYADFLSKIWNIDNITATNVLDHNTQLNLQGANNDFSRQVLTNYQMLQYKSINNQFFTDTFFLTASGVSTRDNNCA